MESNQSTHEIFLHQHFGHMVFQISFPKILLLKIKNFCPSYILIFLQSLLSFLQTIYLLYHLMETLLVYPQEKCQLFHIVNLNLQTIHNPTYHIPESTTLWFQVFQLVYLPNLSVLHWHQ